jgi:hypothetical protein
VRGCLLAFLLSCAPPGADPAPRTDPDAPFPRLIATAADKPRILARLDREPYATVLAALEARRAEPFEEPDPTIWDHSIIGRNAERAQAHAMVAWLFDDQEAAEQAALFLAELPTNFEDNVQWDVNIRMPHTLMAATNTLDLLQATPWMDATSVQQATERIHAITAAFWYAYPGDLVMQSALLLPAQNNHPIRTAAAVGMVALGLPDHPDAPMWNDWAMSELDYLWGPDGQYVQADGGVSEGPFYYGFAYGVSVAYYLAAHQVLGEDTPYWADCRNRSDVDPWTGHGCVDGEERVFVNRLFDAPRMAESARWSMALRLPDGLRPPLGDAYLNSFNGGALVGGALGDGSLRWDWESAAAGLSMTHGIDLIPHHLVHVDDALPAEPPSWTSRVLTDAGNAVYRSGWDADARWLLLVAESGSMRKTLHDHVDGLSFSLAAYGEYLLVDPGYYKPNDLNNAVTSHPEAHNVLLIDGEGAPDKGLLTLFGDADATLAHAMEQDGLWYVEAHQAYQDAQIERSVLAVDGRTFVVADRIEAPSAGPREHAWRLGGNAGLSAGGVFERFEDGALWQRTLGGVELHLASTAAGLVVQEPGYSEGSVPHVHLFDTDRELREHAVVDGVVVGQSPGFLAVLSPYRVGGVGDEAPASVQPWAAGDGITGWLVQSASATDLFVLREPDAPTDFALPDGDVITTDAELLGIRLEGDDPWIVVVRGTSVLRDGLPWFQADEPVAMGRL